MSTGPVLDLIAAHLGYVRAIPSTEKRENILMSTLLRLTTIFENLVATNKTQAADLETAKAAASGKDEQIADLQKQLDEAKASATDGISETDAEALISKIATEVPSAAPAEDAAATSVAATDTTATVVPTAPVPDPIVTQAAIS